MKKYNKLVRDKIPEIIEADGKKCEIEIASKQEHYNLLKQKLIEETEEFLEDENLDKLADIMEVLFALAENLGYKEVELVNERQKKKESYGAFKEKVVLRKVY